MQWLCGALVLVCLGTGSSLGRRVSHDYEEYSDYSDTGDFTETGFVLTPAAREARHTGLDFPQLDESFEDYPQLQRRERDGGFHGGRHGSGGQQRGGRRFGRVQEQPQESRQARQFGGQRQQRGQARRPGRGGQQEEARQGRQSGDIGLALGLLNNPPREDGSYNFNFANDDGSSRQEVGSPASDSMAVSGSYSFVTPEGEVVEMQYTADEFGYHASGSHMPTTPPPPPHVQRLLDHLAKVNGAFVY